MIEQKYKQTKTVTINSNLSLKKITSDTSNVVTHAPQI